MDGGFIPADEDLTEEQLSNDDLRRLTQGYYYRFAICIFVSLLYIYLIVILLKRKFSYIEVEANQIYVSELTPKVIEMALKEGYTRADIEAIKKRHDVPCVTGQLV